MSVVYLAEDTRLERRVALKLLAPELAEDDRFRERFLRESARRVDRPPERDPDLRGRRRRRAPVHRDALRRGHRPEGPARHEGNARAGPDASRSSARSRARSTPRTSAGSSTGTSSPATSCSHAKEGEHVYLSDFGLTKQASSDSGLTETGQFVGTPDYVAPEQIEGEPVGPPADEYALACVLYECLAGQAPFRSDSLMGTLWAHVHDAPPPVSDALDPVFANRDGQGSRGSLPDLS